MKQESKRTAHKLKSKGFLILELSCTLASKMFRVAAKKAKEQPGHFQTGEFTAGPALAVTLSGNKG